MQKLALIGLVLFCALLGGFGQLFFKLGSKDISADITSWLFNWKLIVGIALYATSTILFIIALKFSNLSIAYPIIATSYIWVTLFSISFLGEKFPAIKWLGIILIIGGVAIITQ